MSVLGKELKQANTNLYGMRNPGLLLVLLLSLFWPHKTYSQRNYSITTGFSVPELLNVGIKRSLNNVELGAFVGTFPGESVISISSSVLYHFAGKPRFSTTKPWYSGVGYNFFQSLGEEEKIQLHHLTLRVGLAHEFSKKFGLSSEIGVLFLLKRQYLINKSGPIPEPLGIMYKKMPVLPVLGLNMFYRI